MTREIAEIGLPHSLIDDRKKPSKDKALILIYVLRVLLVISCVLQVL